MTKQEIGARLRTLARAISEGRHQEPFASDELGKLAAEVEAILERETPEREERFKDQYVAAFMAAYKAGEYTERCMMDQHEALRNHGIVEDAEHLAEYAWDAMKDLSKRVK